MSWMPQRGKRRGGARVQRAPIPRGGMGGMRAGGRSRPRLMSTSLLSTLPGLHIWPLNPVVYRETYLSERVGHLILKPASRLDAFSGYPIHT